MPLTRSHLGLEDVEAAILSRMRAFREVPEEIVANQLARYALDLIDAVLSGSQHEIRRDKDGELDELVACHPRFAHLERMSDQAWWLALSTSDGREISVNLCAKRAPVRATIEETSGAKAHSCCLCSAPDRPS